jgi:hypothetical protein
MARLWMRRIDDTLHAACSSITFAGKSSDA